MCIKVDQPNMYARHYKSILSNIIAKIYITRMLQKSGLKVNQPTSFDVSMEGAKGKPEAKVTSPSGSQEECAVKHLEKGTCVLYV